VTLAGTLAVSGTTTTTGVILPLNDGISGIGGPARRYNNVFTANANIYSTANIATANVSNLNVFSLATFVGPITVQDTTRLIGATTVTGTIAPTASGVSGLGGPSAYFANAFLQVANVGTTAPVLSLNVVGNVFVSNTLNVTNILAVSANLTYLNLASWMNISSLNVFTGANVTTLTVSGLSNLQQANIVSSNLQTMNIQYANVATINVWNGANVTTLTVSGLSNLQNANIVSSNLQTTNIQYANVATINVTNAANITTLTVSGLSNLFNANIVSSNLQTTNIQYANVATINVTNAANITTLTVSGLSNLFNANIVSSNLQTMNIQYANVATINVWNGANVTTLTVSGLSNLFNANIVSSNLQTTNIQYANVATINVTNAANITTLTVSGLSNLFNANIVSSNLQTTNIQYANVATINVTNAANITTLTVSGLSNLFNANIVSSNLQTTNIQYANVATINVWNGANVTTLTVSSFANVNLANIVGIVHSTLNVSTQANLQYANMISANVVGTMNVNGLLSARYLTGNGSALMNLHASNISNGVLNFNATNGLGANGIAITGSLGGNGQILASTGGVGAGVQWIGPATGIWSNVAPSINPPPYPIYYGIGNVGIGNTLWTSFGTGFNTYPGAPLDVYGGFGTFSNVSDAPYYGTIRIQNNPATHAAPGGLEFKCGTSGVPGPGGGTGHRLVASELTLGSGIAPLIWQIRSGTWNWSNALAVMCGSAYSGYVGIGTMSPLYQMHVYQNSNTAVSSITAQFSNANQAAYLYLSNTSGTATTLYLNGPNNSSDGPVNSATLRNDAGDLRLAARINSPYIYLQTSTTFVGINTSTPATLLHAVGPGATLRLQSNSSADTTMELYDSGGTKRSNWAYSVSGTYVYNQNDTQDKMRFYNGAGGNVSLQPVAGNVGVGTTTSPQRLLHVLGATNGTGPCLIDYNAAAPTDTALLVRTSAAAATTFYLATLQTSGGSSTRYSVRGDGYVFSTYGFQATNNTNGGAAFLILTNTDAGNAAYPYTQWQSDTGSAYIFKNSSTRTVDGGVKTCTFRNDDGDLRLSAKVDSPSIYLQNSSGNVGIRTVTPLANLQITGAANAGSSGYGHLLVDYANSTSSGGAITIRNSAGGVGAFSTLLFEVDGTTSCVSSTTPAGFAQGNGALYCQNTAANSAAKMGIIQWNGSAEVETFTILPSGNVGIGTVTPNNKLQVYGGDLSGALFGPNATWGSYLYVGSGSSVIVSGKAQVIATNGNLHLDSGVGQQLILQGYNSGFANAGGGIQTYGTLTVAGAITTTGQVSQFNRIKPYSSTYGASYSVAAIEVREYNLENATGAGDMARAPRIGFHWGGVVASSIAMESSGRIGIWDNPGTSYAAFASSTYYCSGNVGIGMGASYRLDVCGRGYLFQSQQSGYGWNRFTGLEADTVRAQFVLNSSYSDLVISSSEYNGNHGSTISFTANSPANNDYRKFVINQNGFTGDASGTGGYGDRLSFDWRDGAYANPHSYVDPGAATMTLYGRGKSVGINNVRTPGYNLHVNGTGYFSTECYVGSWFRVYGGGGIYWESYGGGWNMSDTTWMRVYGGKAIYATNTIATTGDVIAYYSDMRLKKNIVPIEDALEKLMGLSTFTYEANDVAESLGYKTGERNTGFSAQEVKAILPEVIRLAPCDIGETNEVTKVTESKTGENYMTLLYDKMLPFVVKALQEESTARRELQTRVEALEKLLVKE
jgi:uncharacterized protein YjbI with pentapeptide repeats